MARDNFDFPPLTPGQFHTTVFPSGAVMVGWGRARRNKFVQLDQAEITTFLEHANIMVRTDDPVLKDLLGQLAKHLTASRDFTVEELIAGAQAGDEAMIGHIKRYSDLLLSGTKPGEALQIVNDAIRDAASR
jgi:hypothetical protein